MSTNLLRNADFQAPWVFPSQGHEDVQRITANGSEMVRIQNMHVPTDWFACTHDDDTYTQIEMQLGESQERLYEGHTSVKWFSRKRHNAGLYQVVTLTPGHYRLDAWAHCWNWHNIAGTEPGGPYANVKGGLCSIGVDNIGYGLGKGPYFAYGDETDPTSDKPWQDGPLNMSLRLAVYQDTTLQPAIALGRSAHIYNVFAAVPSLEFDVYEAGDVVVSVGCITRWHYVNADVYLGAMALTQLSSTQRGKPRAQYARTYVVYPPGTDLATKHALLDRFPNNTIGPSADDAGVGDLDVRNVLAYNPGGWPGDLHEFFETYYPGINYTVIDGPVPTPSFLLGQREQPWASEKLAGSGCTKTIGATGCWVTNCAMAQRDLGIDVNATPSTANALLGVDGFSGCETKWTAMARLGLRILSKTADPVAVKNWIATPSNAAFVRVKLSSEHWLYVYDYNADADDFIVADPWYKRVGLLRELYPAGPYVMADDAAPWRLICKAQADPVPSKRVLVSFQQQRNMDYRDQFIERVQPPAWMLIGGFEEARHLKSIAPNMKIILRHVDNAWGQYLWASDKPAAASKWISHYGNTLFNQAEYIDYIQGLNEYHSTDDYPALEATPYWIEALVNRMDKLGWPARIIGFNPGVGNPQTDKICDQKGIKRQVSMLVPAARILTDADCLIGYHAYWGVRKLVGDGYFSTLDAGPDYYYSMRSLLDWDPVFLAAGIHAKYAFTEGGPIYVDAQGGTPSSGAGWRYKATYDGDMDATLASIMRWQMLVGQWNAVHEDRARFITLFLHGGWSEWWNFDFRGEPSQRLADTLVAWKGA